MRNSWSIALFAFLGSGIGGETRVKRGKTKDERPIPVDIEVKRANPALKSRKGLKRFEYECGFEREVFWCVNEKNADRKANNKFGIGWWRVYED